MGGGNNNASQTNNNQAALQQQQQQTEQQILQYQQTNNQAINADLGNATANIPNPPGIPSVTAALGPTESQFIANASSLANVTSETQLAAAVDPNQVGILNTFAQSAAGTNASLASEQQGNAAQVESLASSGASNITSLASSGGANPLGAQVSSVPIDPAIYGTNPAPAPASSGSSFGLFAILAVAGIGGFWYLHRKHGAT